MPDSSPPTRHEFHDLVVPYRDTRAEDLTWSLDLPVQPALAVRTVRIGSLVLELRLLGASHQVLLWTDEGGLQFIETLACVPGLTPGMPAATRRTLESGRYHWDSDISELTGERFGSAVDRIREACAVNPLGLAGEYPGAPGALTAVLPGPMPRNGSLSGVRWTTWHSYPQNRQLVRTNSGFRRTLALDDAFYGTEPGAGLQGPTQREGSDGVPSYGAGPPPVAVVSCHRP